MGVFRISFSGVGPTELRILLSIGALVAITRPVVSPFGLGPVALFDLGGAISVAGMAVAFVVSTWRNAGVLYRAEPLPPRGPVSRAARFVWVGAGGFVVQAATLQGLVSLAGLRLPDGHRAGGRGRHPAQLPLARAVDLGGPAAHPQAAGHRRRQTGVRAKRWARFLRFNGLDGRRLDRRQRGADGAPGRRAPRPAARRHGARGGGR